MAVNVLVWPGKAGTQLCSTTDPASVIGGMRGAACGAECARLSP